MEKEIEEKMTSAFLEYLRPLISIDPEFLGALVKAREIQKKLDKFESTVSQER